MTQITLTDIEVSFGSRVVLDVPELALGDSPLTVLLGRNGSGKSTLLNTACAQQQPTKGTISIQGKQLSKWSQRELAQQIAYVPQHLPEVPGLHVSEFVALGRFAWTGAFASHTKQDDDTVSAAMHSADITKYAHSPLSSLSGGERQRAWLAMMIAQQAPLMLLDEPVSALDVEHQFEAMQLLADCSEQAGNAVVVVLHDINLACRFATRIIVMAEGKVAFDGKPATLLDPSTLRHLFGIPFVLLPHDSLPLPLAVPFPLAGKAAHRQPLTSQQLA